MIRLEI